jgi:hypothetical protein
VDEPEVPESAQKNADVQKKLHVEFKEAPEDVSSAKVIVNKVWQLKVLVLRDFSHL